MGTETYKSDTETYKSVKFAVVCQEVKQEVERASSLHAEMNSLHEAYAVILEEVDEFWEQVKVNPKKLTFGQAETRIKAMRSELTQIAAMCVRAIVDQGL